MNTRLVSLTLPYDSGKMGPEDLIVYCARVSSPQNQENMETAPKLLRYLIDHKHWSPFEMVDMTIEIETSRAISAQILRHRSFSFQEYSQRYAEVQDYELYEARQQDTKNRQASHDTLPEATRDWFKSAQVKVWLDAEVAYRGALARGVAKECARFLLPLNTQTRLYMKGSIRSWIHYFDVRCSASTQKEHRDIAVEIRDSIFKSTFPVIHAVINKE